MKTHRHSWRGADLFPPSFVERKSLFELFASAFSPSEVEGQKRVIVQGVRRELGRTTLLSRFDLGKELLGDLLEKQCRQRNIAVLSCDIEIPKFMSAATVVN